MNLIGILVGNIVGPWVVLIVVGSLGYGDFRESLEYGVGGRSTLRDCAGVGTIGDCTGGINLKYGSGSVTVDGIKIEAFMGVVGIIGRNDSIGSRG